MEGLEPIGDGFPAQQRLPQIGNAAHKQCGLGCDVAETEDLHVAALVVVKDLHGNSKREEAREPDCHSSGLWAKNQNQEDSDRKAHQSFDQRDLR